MGDIIIVNVYWDRERMSAFMWVMSKMEECITKVHPEWIQKTNQYLVKDYVYTWDADLLLHIAEAQKKWYWAILFQTQQKMVPWVKLDLQYIDEFTSILLSMKIYDELSK